MSEIKTYRHSITGIVQDYPVELAAMFPDLIEMPAAEEIAEPVTVPVVEVASAAVPVVSAFDLSATDPKAI